MLDRNETSLKILVELIKLQDIDSLYEENLDRLVDKAVNTTIDE